MYFPETGSTNIDAKKAAEEGAPEGTLVVTDCQNTGRGRRGRSWASPKGCNLYFTLLLRPDCKPEQACMLTLVMALAAAEAVEELGINAGIKWPNDIVAHGKKVCGILTEMSAEPDYIHYVVIGCGIKRQSDGFPGGNKCNSNVPCPGKRGKDHPFRPAFVHHGAFRKGL